MTKQRLLLLLLSASFWLQSCVENSLDFPNDEDTQEVTESVALMALLNEVSQNPTLLRDACFRPIYPITLAFNTGISITIESDAGLLQAASGQNMDFYISGISYPVMVTIDDELRSITTEKDFLHLLRECDIPTFGEKFIRAHRQCFSLKYPLSVISSKGDTTSVDGLAAFLAFYTQQDSDYELKLSFPISLDVFSKNEPVSAENYYDLYQVLNQCRKCPDLFFETEEISYGKYAFYGDFHGKHDLTYSWYVNGKPVEEEKPGTADHKLLYRFEPGTYEVCMRAETPGCARDLIFCETITVECVDLDFYADEEWTPGVFKFIANFDEAKEITYMWYIYLDGRLLGEKVVHLGTADRDFTWQFEKGKIYTICLKQDGGCTDHKVCEEFVWE